MPAALVWALPNLTPSTSTGVCAPGIVPSVCNRDRSASSCKDWPDSPFALCPDGVAGISSPGREAIGLYDSVFDARRETSMMIASADLTRSKPEYKLKRFPLKNPTRVEPYLRASSTAKLEGAPTAAMNGIPLMIDF